MVNNNPETDTENYIENPDVLVTLCETVLNELLASVNDTELIEKNTQLSEVSRSIDKLEKLSIGIPDELRNLKISLLTEVEVQIKTKAKVEEILVGLKGIIKIVESTFFTEHPNKKGTRKRYPKSNLPHTNKKVYRPEIIDALKVLGGSGSNKQVLAIIAKRMKDKFLPGDIEKRGSGGMQVWQNNVHWERNAMREDGILQSGSARGIWELSEEYK
jgi:hypothetical protein